MTAPNQHKNTSKGGKYAAKPKTNTTGVHTTTTAATNRSGSVNTISATTVSRRRPKKKKWYQKLDFKKLYNKISKNDVKWYWDLKKWSPILIIILIAIYAIGYNKGEAVQIAYYEALPAETVYIEVTSETTPPETTEPELDEEAVALAILADSSAAGKSDNVKRILMWVAINRVEDHSNGYGGTLLEEIARPKQWQQYNPEGMYLQSTYDIAVEVLETWRTNGPRPIYNDMLWASYNSDGSITVRNVFSGTKGRSEQTFS